MRKFKHVHVIIFSIVIFITFWLIWQQWPGVLLKFGSVHLIINICWIFAAFLRSFRLSWFAIWDHESSGLKRGTLIRVNEKITQPFDYLSDLQKRKTMISVFPTVKSHSVWECMNTKKFFLCSISLISRYLLTFIWVSFIVWIFWCHAVLQASDVWISETAKLTGLSRTQKKYP